jgi:hypothetical protein
VVFPVHPRTAKTLRDLNEVPDSFRLVDPQPYLEFNYLVKNAKAVITDSGGITEETTVMGVPCLTLRDSTERPETVTTGTNELIGTNPAALAPALEKLFAGQWKKGGIPELCGTAGRASGSWRKGDAAAHERLERWLADWCERNPPYRGPNWKCGQEASMRVMHLAMAAVMLGQVDSVAPGLLELVRLHLQRIEPTLRYAMAQDNNHGTSEAAALFIGGSWLSRKGVAAGARWAALGRKWLENRAARLITLDGTFSQYSVTYHRVMLDTFCMVEVWRRRLALAAFSGQMAVFMQAATRWLYVMTRPENGDAPNLGANDGARLLQLTDTDYRDFRPSVQLAAALFWGQARVRGRGRLESAAAVARGWNCPSMSSSPAGWSCSTRGALACCAVAMRWRCCAIRGSAFGRARPMRFTSICGWAGATCCAMAAAIATTPIRSGRNILAAR